MWHPTHSFCNNSRVWFVRLLRNSMKENTLTGIEVIPGNPLNEIMCLYKYINCRVNFALMCLFTPSSSSSHQQIRVAFIYPSPHKSTSIVSATRMSELTKFTRKISTGIWGVEEITILNIYFMWVYVVEYMFFMLFFHSTLFALYSASCLSTNTSITWKGIHPANRLARGRTPCEMERTEKPKGKTAHQLRSLFFFIIFYVVSFLY